MGKKEKNKKKGQGAVKTTAKTEKKLSLKQKKELAAIGEDDIEKIVSQIETEERNRQQVVEHILPPPSRRVNCTLTAHPDKEELILFGGEYFNGQKTFLYNDLYFYNIPRNEWLLVKVPGAPPPRCGHQSVALSAGKGQLWVFGGEYASPTQSQFYHYKDLWLYHLTSKKWEKMSATGGPSARSGHRMVCIKKQLVVFGGFHDNLRTYKYFNDVYSFNLESYQWKKLEPTGKPPAPRSGCQMIALTDGRVLIYGGYSKEKIKKDVDKGMIHSDMFILGPEKNDTTGTKWKWTTVKQSGVRLSARCGTAVALAPGNKAYTFGGVFDIEESEEDLAGTFFNDLQVLDLESTTWRSVSLSGKKEIGKTKSRRRKEKADDSEEMCDSEGDSEQETTESVPSTSTTLADDGVFKVTLGPTPSSHQNSETMTTNGSLAQMFSPSPRMNCSMTVKHSTLYLFGGLVEDGDKQITLADFYSLDLRKLDEWKTLVANDMSTQEWIDSESGSDDSGSDDDDEDDDEEDDDDDEGEEEDDEAKEEIPMDVD